MKIPFKKQKDEFEGGGLILFEATHEAVKAKKDLIKEKINVRLVAPPLSKRIGCDLAIEFALVEKVRVERTLNDKGFKYLNIEAISEDGPKPLDLTHIIDMGDFIMVRAGNMKITVDRKSKIIVNISGGGCPDVPYLYQKLVGKRIHEAQPPSMLGYTLCALMLDNAFDECRRQMEDC